jgi:hypothetical protein
MRPITCANATVQRLQRLHPLPFYNLTVCRLRLHRGHAFRDFAHGLPLRLRTLYHGLSLLMRRRFVERGRWAIMSVTNDSGVGRSSSG